jgi:hypothetical protein
MTPPVLGGLPSTSRVSKGDQGISRRKDTLERKKIKYVTDDLSHPPGEREIFILSAVAKIKGDNVGSRDPSSDAFRLQGILCNNHL